MINALACTLGSLQILNRLSEVVCNITMLAFFGPGDLLRVRLFNHFFQKNDLKNREALQVIHHR